MGVKETASSHFLKIVILVCIYVLAFICRFYSVLRYESMIHEFDPHFNYRVTMYLVREGLYNTLNWFDERAWYPLGRIVGGTVYPGLMLTSGLAWKILHFFNITVDIREVCVFLVPWMASNTTLAAYFLAKEVKDSSAGLLAAAFIGIVPGYISRSVAGSYDYEGVAICAMIITYTLWVRAIDQGSVMYGALTALSYFYMVGSWGGYVFVTNIIPLHAALLIVLGRYSPRLHVAYTSFYILATLMSMQVFFVGFRVVQTADHLATHGVFAAMQVWMVMRWLTSNLNEKHRKWLFWSAVSLAGLVLLGFVGAAFWKGKLVNFSGRFWAMFDVTWAAKHLPIIASVSEHQPTVWTSYFFDTHVLILWFPVGIYHLLRHLNDRTLFLIMYGLLSCYFSGVMVRLMLVLTPALCIVGAVGVSYTLDFYLSSSPGAAMPAEDVVEPVKDEDVKDLDAARQWVAYDRQKLREFESAKSARYVSPPIDQRIITVTGVTSLLVFFVFHCTWVTQAAYSSPSIVVPMGRGPQDGVLDDFREAYYWLRQNTADDATIMSWWDYGYQISSMANRTVLVDNNTWNNSHIAQVGQAFASNEQDAYKIMRRLHVDYALVVFGGYIGYSSDDINKFLWMVRIGGSTDPRIKEQDYYTSRGEFRIDAGGSKTLLNCLMYKLCYYRFDEVQTHPSVPAGYDRVRHAEVGNKRIKLKHLEEAFTSEHWMVRIYRVLEPSARGVRRELPKSTKSKNKKRQPSRKK